MKINIGELRDEFSLKKQFAKKNGLSTNDFDKFAIDLELGQNLEAIKEFLQSKTGYVQGVETKDYAYNLITVALNAKAWGHDVNIEAIKSLLKSPPSRQKESSIKALAESIYEDFMKGALDGTA